MIYYSLFHILWHSSRKDSSLFHISGYVLFWVFGVNAIDSICDIFERESTGKKFSLPSALSNLFCRTNSSSYSKIFLYYFLSYLYFKNLVFFHNKWNLFFFHNKMNQSQAGVKTLNCTYSRASPSRWRVKAMLSISPPGVWAPLPN